MNLHVSLCRHCEEVLGMLRMRREILATTLMVCMVFSKGFNPINEFTRFILVKVVLFSYLFLLNNYS